MKPQEIALAKADTNAIRAELLDVMKEDAAFKPYVEGNANRPHSAQDGMLNNPDCSRLLFVEKWRDSASKRGAMP